MVAAKIPIIISSMTSLTARKRQQVKIMADNSDGSGVLGRSGEEILCVGQIGLRIYLKRRSQTKNSNLF